MGLSRVREVKDAGWLADLSLNIHRLLNLSKVAPSKAEDRVMLHPPSLTKIAVLDDSAMISVPKDNGLSRSIRCLDAQETGTSTTSGVAAL